MLIRYFGPRFNRVITCIITTVRLLEKIWPNNPASETTQHGSVIVIKLTGKKKRTSVTRYVGIMLLRNVAGKKHGTPRW